MTALLEEAINRTVSLPEVEQNRIAEAILELLNAEDDRQWDNQFAQYREALGLLADRALAHVRAGRTVKVSE